MPIIHHPDGHASANHSTSARFTASGRSSVDRCPQSGTTTRRAAGMPAAISCDNAGGVSSSPSPTSTRVGQRIAARSGRGSRRAHDRLLLAHEGRRPGLLRHQAHDAARARHRPGGRGGRTRETAASAISAEAARSRASAICALAPLGLLRRFRRAPRCRAERASRHALGRQPPHGEGDVAAHRQTRRARSAAAPPRECGRRWPRCCRRGV